MKISDRYTGEDRSPSGGRSRSLSERIADAIACAVAVPVMVFLVNLLLPLMGDWLWVLMGVGCVFGFVVGWVWGRQAVQDAADSEWWERLS
ncbi:MAG: hypothetical protein AAF823_11780 [Planctomycetota bacterium]